MDKTRGIEVKLYDAGDHLFTRGRSWVYDDVNGLEIRDEDDEVIALIAPNRWSVVGFR